MEPKTTTTSDPAAIVKQAIADGIEAALAPMRAQLDETTKALKAKATHNTDGMLEAAASRPVITDVKRASNGTGINFARVVKAQLCAALSERSTEHVLRSWGYDDIVSDMKHENEKRVGVQKALGQSIFAEGGAIVPPTYSTELIALLRNITVIRKMGARSVPLNGTLSIPRQSQAGSAFYVSENQPVTPSEQRMNAIVLTERKLMALTAVSNDLVRNASVSAEQFVLQDLLQIMAIREDLAFIVGDGAQETPRGLVNLIVSGNRYDAVAVAPKAPTLAELRREFAKAIALLKAANMPMTKPGWLMSPRTEQYLVGVTDGNGNAVFESQMMSGTLRGFPYAVSNQISETQGNTAGTGSDFSRLILCDFDQELIGDSAGVETLVVPNGTYEESGSTRSGLSRDQSVIRVIAKHDHNLRYDTCAVSVATQMGAP